MEKVLTIGGKDCKFKTSAALPRLYRIKFRRDLFNDLNYVQKSMDKHTGEDDYLPPEALTTFENLAYIMHKHGDPTQPNSIDKWLEQFETFDIYQIFPELFEMWSDETETTVEPKKEQQK